MEEDIHTDVTIRIILVGDSSTGKTSLLLRYIDTKFSVKSVATVGIDFRTKIMTFGSTVVKVQIFDTAGQERFHTITQAYYRNAAGALIVFDITNQASFRNMDAQAASAVKLIVGNKCDMEESRSVPRSQAHKLAEEIGCRYLEASAMTGQNVEEAFNSTISSILIKRGIIPGSSSNISIPPTTPTTPSQESPPAPTLKASGGFQLRNSMEAKKEESNGGCC